MLPEPVYAKKLSVITIVVIFFPLRKAGIVLNDKKTLIGLNLSVFLMMLGVGMIVAVLPQRILDFTSDSSQVGYLASAFALSYIALQVPIGNLADKYGFKLFLTLGYILCFFTGGLYYLSNSANLIFLGRLFQGIGEAPVWALAPALLSIKYPLARAKVMGVYNASIHIGLTLGPMFGVLFSRILSGNQFFLLYALVCALGAAIIYISVEDPQTNTLATKQSLSLKSLLNLAKDRGTAIVLIGITLYGAGYGTFLTNVPAYLLGVKNYSQALISIFFSLFYVAISVSQVLTGPLSDKFGRRLFMIIGLYTSGVGLLLFSQLDHPWTIIILTLASLGLGIFYLSSMAFLNDIVPNSLKGTISGAYYLCWGIGFFFGPIIIGQLGRLPGFNKGFYIFSLLLIVEAIIMMTGSRQQPNPTVKTNHGSPLT